MIERASSPPTTPQPPDLHRAVDARVLNRFAPAHVVVNSAGDIVHFSARTGGYLEPAPGAPTQQLTVLARRDLKPDLRSALRQAVETGAAVRRDAVALTADDGRIRTLDIVIEPLPARDDGEPLFIVLFIDRAGPVETGDSLPGAPEEAAANGNPDPSSAHTRLRAVNEDYEVALQELRWSSEALAAAEADVHALQIANDALNARNDRLDRTNADLLDLVKGADVATVLLGRDLAIRGFTPSVKALFNIRPEDIGRPLTDLSSQVALPGMVEAVQSVFATGVAIEQRVYQDATKTHFLVRFTPSGGAEGAPDRTVEEMAISFVDITRLTHDQAKQQMVIAELNHRVKNMLTVVIGLAQQTHQTTDDPQSFIERFTSRLGGMARSYDLLSHEHWTETSLDRLVRTVLAPFDIERVKVDGPAVSLEPQVTLSLGMVLHELVTNAGKFGALSTPDGTVSIRWRVSGGDGGETLVLRWVETEGPIVASPGRHGFGLKFVEREVAYNLAGESQIQFKPGGLEARIALPLKRSP